MDKNYYSKTNTHLSNFIGIEVAEFLSNFNAKCDIFDVINIAPKYTFRRINIWKIYISSQLLQQKTPFIHCYQ